MNFIMVSNTLWQDLKWSLFLTFLSLFFAALWQWPIMEQSYRGELFSQIKELERQKAAQLMQGLRTYNLQQALELHQQGETIFIDARPPGEYRELHVEGAINLTADDLHAIKDAELSKRLPSERPLIVYCGHADCHASLKVAELLQNRGFKQVAVFLEGFRAWDEAGYPVDVSR
jgi:rhodanese-related sulfurtransferase